MPSGSSPNRQRRGARAATWLARGGGLLTLLLISHTARWIVRDTPAHNVFAEHSGTLLYLIDVPLLVCLIGWLATLRYGPPLRFPPVLAPTFGLAALSALSALWAEARPMLALEIGARLALLTGFALYLASGQAGRWSPVAALIGGAAFQAAIAVLQFARGAWLGLTFLGEIDLGPALDWMRGYGLTVHPNTLARHLTLGLFAALGGAMSTAAYRRRVVAGGLAALIGAGLFVTFSRAAWLGVVGGSALLIGLSTRRDLATARRRLARALVGLAILALALTVRYWGLVRYRWLGPLSPGDEPTSEHAILSERAYYAEVARRMIADHPLLGVGAGNFSVASLHYGPGPHADHINQPVHNTPLLILAELGPGGLILWVSAFGVVAWGTTRALRDQRAPSVWLLVWTAALLALGIASLFDYVIWADQRGRLMWLAALGLWANEARRLAAISPPKAAALRTNAASNCPKKGV